MAGTRAVVVVVVKEVVAVMRAAAVSPFLRAQYPIDSVYRRWWRWWWRGRW